METTKHLITWILLVVTIVIILGTIYEIRTCSDTLVRGIFWWECVK